MAINLRPELERLIQQDVERGPYKTVDELVERAAAWLCTWPLQSAASLQIRAAPCKFMVFEESAAYERKEAAPATGDSG